MGRGVSAGGGRSSLDYLFGGGEASNKAQAGQRPTSKPINNDNSSYNTNTNTNINVPKPTKAIDPQIPAGIQTTLTNNYFRADGQNCGNFITDRPSTKVHAAPGGGSSLGYLFGGSDK